MQFKNPKILWLDDDPEYTADLRGLLKAQDSKMEIKVMTRRGAKEAEQELQKTKYDALVLDFRLHSEIVDISYTYTGLEYTSLISKVWDYNPEVKILIFSDYLSDSEINKWTVIKHEPFFLQWALREKDPKATASIAEKIKDILQIRNEELPKTTRQLIIPVKQNVSSVNRRLSEYFRKDPELLWRIEPRDFEHIVAELFEEQGYEVYITQATRDGGKDLYVFRKDTMTNSLFLVECKRYRPPKKVDVSVPRQLYGVVTNENATGGIIATTSYFTAEALKFAETTPHRLFLHDFDDISRWLKAG